MTRCRLGVATATIVLLAVWPAFGGQAGSLPASEATAFLGTWIIRMTNPPGAQETVRIFDKSGMVAASVQLGTFPPSDVTGIIKDGDMLVLTTRRRENGQPIWVVMSLTVDADRMTLAQMLEHSETIKRGSGARQ
jgi:hypothetical protein